MTISISDLRWLVSDANAFLFRMHNTKSGGYQFLHGTCLYSYFLGFFFINFGLAFHALCQHFFHSFHRKSISAQIVWTIFLPGEGFNLLFSIFSLNFFRFFPSSFGDFWFLPIFFIPIFSHSSHCCFVTQSISLWSKLFSFLCHFRTYFYLHLCLPSKGISHLKWISNSIYHQTEMFHWKRLWNEKGSGWRIIRFGIDFHAKYHSIW